MRGVVQQIRECEGTAHLFLGSSVGDRGELRETFNEVRDAEYREVLERCIWSAAETCTPSWKRSATVGSQLFVQHPSFASTNRSVAAQRSFSARFPATWASGVLEVDEHGNAVGSVSISWGKATIRVPCRTLPEVLLVAAGSVAREAHHGL